MEPENQHFGLEMTPEDRAIDQSLAKAFSVTPPDGLCDRVTRVSLESLNNPPDQELERDLDAAFAMGQNKGLGARIFAGSASSLPMAPGEHPVVIGRIDSVIAWRQVALAACLVFAAFVAIRFGGTSPNDIGPVTAGIAPIPFNVLEPEDELQLFEYANLGEFAYLADTRELAFEDVALDLNDLRQDVELWRSGLLED